MSEYKTWGRTETGSVFHSFEDDGVALCRRNVKAGLMFYVEGGLTEAQVDTCRKNSPHLFSKCASCAKKEAAHRDRVDASMMSVNPYDQVCEGVVTPEGETLVAGDECETVIDTEAMRQADDALSFAMAAGAPGRDDTEATAVWNSLTEREQGLIHDAAVMGYVQGMRHPDGEPIGKDRQTIARVLDACLAFPDLYPTMAAARTAARQTTGQDDTGTTYAMAVGAPGMPKVGDSFSQTHDTFRNGYRETVEVTVRVQAVTDCRDIWTGRIAQLAVRFTMVREGSTSQYTLPLDQFRDTWM